MCTSAISFSKLSLQKFGHFYLALLSNIGLGECTIYLARAYK